MSTSGANQVHRSSRFFRLVTWCLSLGLGAIGIAALYIDRVSPDGAAKDILPPAIAVSLMAAATALALRCACFKSNVLVAKASTATASLIGFALASIGATILLQGIVNIGLPGAQAAWPVPLDGLLRQAGNFHSLTPAYLILIGIGIMSLDHSIGKGHYPAEYAALVAAGLMGIPVIGYLYNAGGLVQIVSSTAVPLPAAVLCILMAIALLTARPSHRLMRLWNSNAPGGHLLRELLPKSLLLLVLLDLLVEGGARRGLYAQENVSSLVVLLTTAWLTVLFWRAASLLNREYDVRRKGEAALSQTNALLRAVSDNIPDAIFVKDRDGRMVFANPAMLNMLGKSAEGVIGKASSEIYTDTAAAGRVETNDRQVMENGKVEMVEETVNFEYGTRTLYSTKAPWLDEEGRIRGLVGISIDITERKRMEDALKAHETQLEALVAARTAEVSELIGHLESTREEEKRAIARELHDDLGSELTALNMHLAILFQQMPAEPRLAERSAQVKALLASVTQTTRRIQAGLRPDKLDIFGIKTAISEQALEFEDYTGIRCSASLPDEEVSYTPQIEIALFRMVQEALNNIAKHAKASRVDVVLDDDGDRVILSIRDDGVGMPPAPAGNTLTHGLRGMRERAGYLGGEVQIASEPGKGTKIVITLPKPAPAENDAAGAAAEDGQDDVSSDPQAALHRLSGEAQERDGMQEELGIQRRHERQSA